MRAAVPPAAHCPRSFQMAVPTCCLDFSSRRSQYIRGMEGETPGEKTGIFRERAREGSEERGRERGDDEEEEGVEPGGGERGREDETRGREVGEGRGEPMGPRVKLIAKGPTYTSPAEGIRPSAGLPRWILLTYRPKPILSQPPHGPPLWHGEHKGRDGGSNCSTTH